jgi:1-acylglycerone phosphate reductase
MKKNVLVTGCSTGGLGNALAKAFRDHGYHVLATVRNSEKASDLASEKDIEVFTLDVTSSESIASCLAQVRKKTSGKLDVLVNNAGVAIFGIFQSTDNDSNHLLIEIFKWQGHSFTPRSKRAKLLTM